MSHVLPATALALVGLAAGWGVRLTSVRLARKEELEVVNGRLSAYGPPALTAFAFAAYGYAFAADSVALGFRCVVATVLIQVLFFDLEHGLILDWVVLPSIALALFLTFFRQPWWEGVAMGSAAGFGFVMLGVVGSILLKADAVGLGDAKLAVLVGLLLGQVGTAEALLISFAMAGLVAIGVAIWQRSLKGSVAFGPFLASGTMIVLYLRP